MPEEGHSSRRDKMLLAIPTPVYENCSNFRRARSQTTRSSLTQQMKRHLPWVLSSFRSSKRRQQVSTTSNDCQTARLQGWDDSFNDDILGNMSFGRGGPENMSLRCPENMSSTTARPENMSSYPMGISTSRSMDYDNLHPARIRRTVSEWASSTVNSNITRITVDSVDDDYDMDIDDELWRAQKVQLLADDENHNQLEDFYVNFYFFYFLLFFGKIFRNLLVVF